MKKTMVVLGAGPAGLSCALEGARKGLKVTLLEKKQVGDRINCGEGFFDLFSLAEKPVSGILYKVKYIIISALNTYTLDSSSFNLWMIDRQQWQKALAELAVKEKVNLLENHAVKPIDVASLSRQFDWVVDATGVVGLTTKVPQNLRQAYQKDWWVTLQCLLQGDFSSYRDSFKVKLLQDCTGYCWLFPKDTSLARAGVAVFKSGSKRVNLNEPLEIFLKEQQNYKTYTLLEKKGGRIPAAPLWPLLKRENIFLAGDAAGRASPLHGGGLDTAVASGTLLGRCLAAGEPETYPAALREALSHKMNLERKISWCWQKLGLTFMDCLLKIINLSGLTFLLNKMYDYELPLNR